ncbi:hypothetical protein [Vibrio sp. 10N.261.55.A7]|uniref:hypothetical protein n=1 Tax=Vibrio sp. 10N.261.55.A7 TaxID=1880851 RepID=UPI000C82896E|nr:hypothetical protein [Vibrio sp. 10N.261.55.A7]PMJ92872.1 hypothetical protein BCU12_06945 [Vibrio sp. 10N.261.55.A7]
MKVVEEKGILESISSGKVILGNSNNMNTVSFIKFNDKRYGPVLFDNHLEPAMKQGGEMTINMLKKPAGWFVASIKMENGETYASNDKLPKRFSIINSLYILGGLLVIFSIIGGFAANLLNVKFESFWIIAVLVFLSSIIYPIHFLKNELKERSVFNNLVDKYGSNDLL